ncbi:glutathione S-transferase [Vibrio astriarenae]
MKSQNKPILYSLHNCPYAIRARLALVKAQQSVTIRAVKLDNKPEEMLNTSQKGSVPVLVMPDATVIEESLDIMVWALSQNDPKGLLSSDNNRALPEMLDFIASFENDFIPALIQFSSAKRYHEQEMFALRELCEIELAKLEGWLSQHALLFGERESLVDIAIVPFIRKFARIDKPWFRDSPYPYLRRWLEQYLQSRVFTITMKHYPLWLPDKVDVTFDV